MSGKLARLKERRKSRATSLAKHSRRWKAFVDKDQRTRAAYQRRRIIAGRRAIRKLDQLIKEEALKVKRRINWNGHPKLKHKPLLKALRTALTVPGLYITSTTDGQHSPGSWHYSGHAFDGGSNSRSEGPEIKAQNLLLKEYGAGYFKELFGPDDWYVKNGVRYKGTFPHHHDHLHVAV